MASKKSAKNAARDDEGLLLDEDGIPILDFSHLDESGEVSHRTAVDVPKWVWWILLSICLILVILSVLIPSQGLILGGMALAMGLFITHYGKEPMLENYEKRVKERYGDRVELSPEQRRELRLAIAEAERITRQEKKLARRAKREARRTGRNYEEVLKEIKAAEKAEAKAKAEKDAEIVKDADEIEAAAQNVTQEPAPEPAVAIEDESVANATDATDTADATQ